MLQAYTELKFSMSWLDSQIVETEKSKFFTVSAFCCLQCSMLIFDLEYTGPAFQTKVPCYLYCWSCAERKYKQSCEEGIFDNSINGLKNGNNAFP